MRGPITSPQNPQIKHVVRLRRRRERERCGQIIIDGARALHLALESGLTPTTVYIAADKVKSRQLLLDRAGALGAIIQPLAIEPFQRISYGDAPDPVVALAATPTPLSLDDLPRPATPWYLIVEGLEKPGNLGAILRSADAVGIDGVIACDTVTDLYNPNIIRSSRGAIFTVPICVSSTPTAIAWLHRHGVQVFAASPAGERLHTAADFSGSVALAVGAEHSGLSNHWLAEALVKIPMRGQIDSLNVAQSATVLLYEALRQRTSS